MTLSPIPILATGSCRFAAVPDETGAQPEQLVNLKPVIKQLGGKSIRRITRFVQLALAGALECCRGTELKKNTGVYLSSCRGDTSVTVELLDELICERQPPNPITFVNSVSNAACFQVASMLGLESRSSFVTNHYDPLVAAARLAQIDLQDGSMPTALVGSVDCLTLPLSSHRQRMEVEQTRQVGEASHWLLLGQPDVDAPAAGWIEFIGQFPDRAALLAGLQQLQLADGDLLGIGQHLDNDILPDLKSAGLNRQMRYCGEDQLHYDSPTGEGIIRFLQERDEPRMIHINSDPSERYSVVVVKRG